MCKVHLVELNSLMVYICFTKFNDIMLRHGKYVASFKGMIPDVRLDDVTKQNLCL